MELEGLEKISYTLTLGLNTTYQKKVPDWVPGSAYFNYSASISGTGTISNVDIKEASNISYIIKLRVPRRWSLYGTKAVATRYDTYIYNGSDLDGVTNPENWKLSTNYLKTFEDGLINGFIVGAGDYILEGIANKIIGQLAGVAKLARSNPKLAARILNAEKTVKDVANKIADANPKLIKAIERKIKDINGKVLTDFDIETTNDVIIEVTSGQGKGKITQLIDRIIPNSGNKEVILFGPNIKGGIIKDLKRRIGDKVKVFRNTNELVKYLKNKK